MEYLQVAYTMFERIDIVRKRDYEVDSSIVNVSYKYYYLRPIFVGRK